MAYFIGPPIPPMLGQQQPTDEELAQKNLADIEAQLQNFGQGQETPQQLGPPGFLESLYNAGLSQPSFTPTSLGAGFLQGLTGGLASRGQKVAQKRQQIEALIEQQRQARTQQQLQDLQMRRANAFKELNDIKSEHRATTREQQKYERDNPVVNDELIASYPDLNLKPMKGQRVSLADINSQSLKANESAVDTGTLTGPALDIVATQYAKTGQLPPLGFGKSAVTLRTKVFNRAAEIDPNLDVASAQAIFTSNKSALGNLRKLNTSAKAFEQTALKNADTLEGTLGKLADTGSPWVNRPIRNILAQGTGDPNVTAFRTALETVSPEFARLLNSPTASGQLSDTAREEIRTILSPNATPAQLRASLRILRTDAHARTQSYDNAIKDLEYSIAHPGDNRPVEVNTTQAQATHRYNPKTGTIEAIGP